jgi:hypothetical protein
MEIRLERLLGTRVLDPDGRHVGRIEEVHAHRRDGEVVVTEYVLGAAGLVERLSLGPILKGIVGRSYPVPDRYTVAHADLDLSDPTRPRLRRRLDELERRVQEGRPRRRGASA